MASIRKHPRSRFWYACFTDHTGRQRQRSTGETSRQNAMSRAIAYEESYQKVMSESQARKVIADIYEEVHGERLISSTTQDFVGAWLERKRLETSKSSYDSYKLACRRLLAFLGDKTGNDINFVTRKDIEAFRNEVGETLSPGTANNYLKIIRMVFREAWRDGLVQGNEAAKVDPLARRGQERQRRAFTLDEIRALLGAAEGEWHGMILAGIYTGQRLGDLANLTWDRVDLEQEEVGFKTIKTGLDVRVPVARPLLAYLRSAYPPPTPRDPVFPEAFKTFAATGKVSKLSQQFHALLVTAGISEKPWSKDATGRGRSQPRKSEGLSFHCLRHTATSLLKNAGVSEAVAMDIIGHRSKEISRVYTHIDSETKREAIRKLPDLGLEK